MPGFQRTLTVAAPPAKVFAVLTDLAQAPQWMPAIQKTEWVTGDKVAAGAVWKEWRKTGKRTMQATLDVARIQPDKALDLHVTAPMFRMDLGFDLYPEGKGTRVEYRCHGKGTGLMALLSGPMMKSIEKHDDDLLVRLKAQVERKAPKA